MPIVKSTSVNSRLISFPLLKWCRLNPYSIASIISFRRMSSRRKREKTKVRKCQSSTWKRSKPCFIQKHLTHSLNLRASVTTTVWWTLSHYCIIRNDVTEIRTFAIHSYSLERINTSILPIGYMASTFSSPKKNESCFPSLSLNIILTTDVL